MAQEKFDILETFENTKKSIEANSIANGGKLELLTDLVKFFKQNNLEVYKNTEETKAIETDEKSE